jgi:hypothetical protein
MNREYPFNIIDNDVDDIVCYIVDEHRSKDQDKNPQSEVQYLEGVIKDLDFIRSSYILREKGEYWDGEEG